MKFYPSLLGLILLFHTGLSAQIKNVSVQSFDSLFTKGRVYFLHEKSKEYYGCGYNLEGIPLNLFFNSITIDPAKKEMRLVGYAHMGMNEHDTIGIPNLNIFLAKPRGNRLTNKKSVAILSNNMNTLKTKWNPTTGFFDITFLYKKDLRLYFESGGIFCTREHNLPKFLSNIE
jgi:hypothetical protein